MQLIKLHYSLHIVSFYSLSYTSPMLDQRFAASVHIMTVIAYHQGERMTSGFLAKSIRTNPIVVRRLLAKLVEAGLLESFKGKSGGVCLSKEAKEISLKDIYLAVTNKTLINCMDKEPQKLCAVSCAFKKIFSEVADGLENSSMNYLAKIKLSDLSGKV